MVIAGPSGSGKSTLGRCLAGFIPHEYLGEFQGSVIVQNQDSTTSTIPDLARKISLVQQDPDSQLVTLSVMNELAFGPENFLIPPNEIREKADWALNAISAQHLQARNTYALSGGEKQKIIIASFLCIQGPILLLDEPTARLDPTTAEDVIRTLRQLNRKGLTIIVIEHRIQPFLAYATRVVLLNNGTLFFNGTPSQLQANPETLINLGVALHPSAFAPVASPPLPTPHQKRLEVQNLTFTYPETETKSPNPPAIEELSFSLHPGEIIALMGPNGSGKTTLLMHIIGLLKPDVGTIFLDGEPLHRQPVSQIARKVGFIFQNPLHQIFTSTVWDEILLASRHLGVPLATQAQAQAEILLDAMGLQSYRDQSPFSLSLGEQRRLTIASVLLHRPKLLLLDEPFIGQDYRNVHQLMTLLQQSAQQDTTIVLATHDAAIAETYCQRLLFLHSGQLLIDAPVKQGLDYIETLGKTAYQHKPTTREVTAQL